MILEFIPPSDHDHGRRTRAGRLSIHLDVQFVYVDGHVEFLQDSIDLDLYQNLSTIAGEPLAMDEFDKQRCQGD